MRIYRSFEANEKVALEWMGGLSVLFVSNVTFDFCCPNAKNYVNGQKRTGHDSTSIKWALANCSFHAGFREGESLASSSNVMLLARLESTTFRL